MAVWNVLVFQTAAGRAISQRSFVACNTSCSTALRRRVTRTGSPVLRPGIGAAHDAGRRSSGLPARQVGGSRPVEMIIGIALIVIAALEIWFIIRTVQSNMGSVQT